MSEPLKPPFWMQPGRKVGLQTQMGRVFTVTVERVLKTKVVVVSAEGSKIDINFRGYQERAAEVRLTTSKKNAWTPTSVELFWFGSPQHLAAMSYSVKDAIAGQATYLLKENRSDPNAVARAAEMLDGLVRDLNALVANQREAMLAGKIQDEAAAASTD